MDWTQLQFDFCSVPISNSFPFGVKMTYRKYSQDQVLLIEPSEDPDALVGFKVYQGLVRNQPEAVGQNLPEGMYLLKSLPLPDTVLAPTPFVQGSRALLEKVVAAVIRQWAVPLPHIAEEWGIFRDRIAP